MGNQCCSLCESSSAPQSSLIKTQTSKPSNLTQKPTHIDSEGVPVPNAYKRYVKPPTTVGRQSVVVRNLHDNQDVPDWIWATQNQNILNSGTKQNPPNVQPFNRPYANHRHTYQPIEGRFKGVETVNLSKLQNKPLTSSENQKPRLIANNPLHGNYSVQPNAFVKSGFGNINNTQSVGNQGTNQVGQHDLLNPNLKKTFSINDVPVVSSINMNRSESKEEMKMTESKSIPMSPFQMITQEQNDRNQLAPGFRMVGSNAPHIQSGFNSNAPSVNNSIQRPSQY